MSEEQVKFEQDQLFNEVTYKTEKIIKNGVDNRLIETEWVMKPDFLVSEYIEKEAGKMLQLPRPCPGTYIIANFEETFSIRTFLFRIMRRGTQRKEDGTQITDGEIQDFIVKNPNLAKRKCLAFLSLVFMGGEHAKKLIKNLEELERLVLEKSGELVPKTAEIGRTDVVS